jgi:hypothetical protein
MLHRKTGAGNLFICLIISLTIVREFFFCDEKSQFTIRACPVKSLNLTTLTKLSIAWRIHPVQPPER